MCRHYRYYVTATSYSQPYSESFYITLQPLYIYWILVVVVVSSLYVIYHNLNQISIPLTYRCVHPVQNHFIFNTKFNCTSYKITPVFCMQHKSDRRFCVEHKNRFDSIQKYTVLLYRTQMLSEPYAQPKTYLCHS